jgi:hypothetical protein
MFGAGVHAATCNLHACYNSAPHRAPHLLLKPYDVPVNKQLHVTVKTVLAAIKDEAIPGLIHSIYIQPPSCYT